MRLYLASAEDEIYAIGSGIADNAVLSGNPDEERQGGDLFRSAANGDVRPVPVSASGLPPVLVRQRKTRKGCPLIQISIYKMRYRTQH